jgi:hypothetical protein
MKCLNRSPNESTQYCTTIFYSFPVVIPSPVSPRPKLSRRPTRSFVPWNLCSKLALHVLPCPTPLTLDICTQHRCHSYGGTELEKECRAILVNKSSAPNVPPRFAPSNLAFFSRTLDHERVRPSATPTPSNVRVFINNFLMRVRKTLSRFSWPF